MIPIYLLLLGCQGDRPGAADTEVPVAPCTLTETPATWAEASPDGTVPEDAIADLEGAYTGWLEWDGGEATELTVTWTRAGDPLFLDSEPVDPGGPRADECVDDLWVSADIRLVTADGQLDVSWPISSVSVRSLALPWSFSGELLSGESAGTWTPPGDVVNVDEDSGLSFEGELNAAGTAGTIVFWGSEPGIKGYPQEWAYGEWSELTER